MIESHNILTIENLSLEQKGTDILYLKCILNAKMDFCSPISSKKIMTFHYESESTNGFENRAIKNCIEGFMNGDFNITKTDYHNNDAEHNILSNGIHAVDVKLQEPFYSLFNNLFDITKWESNNEFVVLKKPQLDGTDIFIGYKI